MLHVTILGKRYRLRFARLRTKDGDCSDPGRPGHEIRIRTGVSEKRELEVLIHEVLHAADWWKDERWVEEVGRDLARLLWRLGYRRQTELDGSST